MADNEKFDETFGVDMPLGEARQRFAKATLEDIDDMTNLPLPIPEGEMEMLLFKGAEVRRICHNDEWWYSVVDVIGAVVGTERASQHWHELKAQLVDKEGFSDLSQKIGKLPLLGSDGKNRNSEVATIETMFRLIQSLSVPGAERIKRWLAKVGYERIQEWQDPEIAIKRAILSYQMQGRSDDWIEKRIRTIVARKELTNEWKNRGIKEGVEYASLTNAISQGTFGIPVKVHMTKKALAKGHNLRDHMTDLELVLTMLGETSTKEIAVQRDAQGYSPNFHAAVAGGSIAGSARKQIEAQTGRPVVSEQNFLGKVSRVADPQLLTRKAGGS
jgi:prophage antirepressor-like protein